MKYDVTLKEILQSGAPQLWQALAGGQPVEFLTVEFPSIQMRKPDLLVKFADGALVHLELQGDNEAAMEWRELEYYALIYRLYQRPPIQYVLYFGLSPLTMRDSIVTESLQFRYRLIDIRLLKSELLLASEALGDAVLALLADTGEIGHQEIIRAVAGKFSKLPAKEQRDWFGRLMILSGLRGVENIVQEEAQKMGISMDIRDNLFFKEAYAAGVEDGLEKGGAAMLQRQLERRFGALPAWTQERIEQAGRADIERMGLRLLDAARIEDVFDSNANGEN